jgi:hypothetical protein
MTDLPPPRNSHRVASVLHGDTYPYTHSNMCCTMARGSASSHSTISRTVFHFYMDRLVDLVADLGIR